MKRRTLLLGCLSVPPAWMASRVSAELTPLKRVFAHYMVAWPRGGPDASIDDYIAEFLDAQQRGIDGFALNCGGWNNSEPLYRARVLKMYRAAAQLGSGFKLFVSADGNAHDELRDIVKSTAVLPAQLRIGGKPVVSAYALGGKDPARCEALIEQAESLGVYFVPHFMPSTSEAEIDGTVASEVANRCRAAQGYFYFGAAGAPESLARSVKSLATSLKSAGKLFMASVTPYYRGLPGGTNYRAFETDGFSGMETEWLATIQSNVDWVQMVTWNDWAESTYVAPIGSHARAQIYSPRFGALLNHGAYLDASRYFIEWFKCGAAPSITQDKFYYFYRLHPVSASAMTGTDASLAGSVPPRSRTVLTELIHVTLFLTQPATLVIAQGDVRMTHDLPAGVSEVAAQSLPGTPRFTLIRNGRTIVDKKGGESIRTDDFSGAFNYFSGS